MSPWSLHQDATERATSYFKQTGRTLPAKALEAALTGPLDAPVRDRMMAEARGNPLALLELPRGLPPAGLAGGFALPDAIPLSGRIEASFRRRLDALPDDTRVLVQLAAADPVGDPVLMWRAAARLGIATEAAMPAADAGAARGRHPRSVSASAGAFGGLPVGLDRATTRGAWRAGGGHRCAA